MNRFARSPQRRTPTSWSLGAVAAACFLMSSAVLAGPAAPSLVAQSTEIGLTATERVVAVEVTTPAGERHRVALADGRVEVDGSTRATFPRRGLLEDAWREFVTERASTRPGTLAEQLRGWEPPAGAESEAVAALREGIRGLLRVLEPAAAGAPTGAAEEAESTGAAAAGAPAADTAPPESVPADTALAAPDDTAAETGPRPGGIRIVPGPLGTGQLSDELERMRRSLEGIGRQAVRAVGDLALVVHDDYTIGGGERIPGTVAVVEGDLRLRGTVDGDVLVLGGELVLEDGGRVTGDVINVGGDVDREGGVVEGEIVSLEGAASRESYRPDRDRDRRDVAPPFTEGRDYFSRAMRNVASGISGFFAAVSFFVVLGLLGMATSFFAEEHFEVMADTVRHSFGRSFLAGLAGEFLFLPALVALAIGIITAVLIPFFIVAVGLAFLVGYLAVARGAGEALALRDVGWVDRIPYRGRYRHLFLGLAILIGLFALASLMQIFGGLLGFLQGLTYAVAGFLSWAAFTAGFGAVLLSRAGTRRDHAFARRGAATGDLFAGATGGASGTPGGSSAPGESPADASGGGPGAPGGGPEESSAGPTPGDRTSGPQDGDGEETSGGETGEDGEDRHA